MTQNNKPEWFEITDADEKPANPAISQLPTGGGDDDDDDEDEGDDD
jgi:hypothetical protein